MLTEGMKVVSRRNAGATDTQLHAVQGRRGWLGIQELLHHTRCLLRQFARGAHNDSAQLVLLQLFFTSLQDF